MSQPDASRPLHTLSAPVPTPDAVNVPPSNPAPLEGLAPVVPGYAIEGELGRGGMGVVYKARNLKLNRTVALKMILTGRQAGPAERARFRAEVEAVAKLSHANIVQVFEVGETGGVPWCALEFCPKGSLADVLKSGPLPTRGAAHLVRQLARAVQHAHAHNIVHRDLKPANVLVTKENLPKVTDFGLAKHADGDSELTGTGQMMGTPAYMAPEQWTDARRAGPAADVWALGVILYESLTGRRPFVGETQHAIMAKVLNDDAPAFGPEVPTDLGIICRKCLRREPAERYASAEALADDLRHWLNGEPITARSVGRGERVVKWVRRHVAATALLAVVVLALVVGAAVALSFGWHAAEQTRLVRMAEARATTAETARQEAEIWKRDAIYQVDSERKARFKAEGDHTIALIERDMADRAFKRVVVANEEVNGLLRRSEKLVYAGKIALAQA